MSQRKFSRIEKKTMCKFKHTHNTCNFLEQFVQVFRVSYQFWIIFNSIVWETDLKNLQVTWEEPKMKKIIEQFDMQFEHSGIS